MTQIESERVLQRLKAVVVEEGSQTAAAERMGVNVSYLSRVLAGRQEPGEKILDAIGFVKIVGYVPSVDVQTWSELLKGSLGVVARELR